MDCFRKCCREWLCCCCLAPHRPKSARKDKSRNGDLNEIKNKEPESKLNLKSDRYGEEVVKDQQAAKEKDKSRLLEGAKPYTPLDHE